jgi:hypothetical protein
MFVLWFNDALSTDVVQKGGLPGAGSDKRYAREQLLVLETI